MKHARKKRHPPGFLNNKYVYVASAIITGVFIAAYTGVSESVDNGQSQNVDGQSTHVSQDLTSYTDIVASANRMASNALLQNADGQKTRDMPDGVDQSADEQRTSDILDGNTQGLDGQRTNDILDANAQGLEGQRAGDAFDGIDGSTEPTTTKTPSDSVSFRLSRRGDSDDEQALVGHSIQLEIKPAILSHLADLPPIPKKIHVIWPDRNVVNSKTEMVKHGLRKMIDLNPDWTVAVHEYADIDLRIKNSKLHSAADRKLLSEAHIVEKTDAFRLLVLYEEGGFYQDIDRVYNIPLDDVKMFTLL